MTTNCPSDNADSPSNALLFGFFGINATEVNDRVSMFDHRYLPIYLLVLMIIVLAVGIYITLAWQEKRQSRDRRKASVAR